MADEFKRLDLYLAQDSPLSWQACFKTFLTYCQSKSDTNADGTDSIVLTTSSFEIKSLEEGFEIKYIEPVKSEEEEEEEKKDSKRPEEAYMAPEHLLEAELDERSRIYSLGCIFYECLTGTPPFADKKAKTLAENHIAFEPRPVSKLSAEPLPDCVSNLIHKCIEKDPQSRFQSFNDLVEALTKVEEEASEEIENKKNEVVKVKESKPLYISGSIMLAFTFVIVGTIYLTNSKGFQAYIYNSRTKNENKYFLGIEDQAYRRQMDFKDGKPRPVGDKIPIMIKQAKSGKILFATTQKKNIKEALEEAYKRGLMLPNADLKGCDLKGINLEGAFLSIVDLTGADLSGANLSNTVMHGSRFWNTNLTGATIVGARLERADLLGANCEKANLQNIFMPGSRLDGANFKNADLTNATLSGASVKEANFEGANMTNVMAENVEWMKEKVLTKEQFDKTIQGLQAQGKFDPSILKKTK